jgi:pimeloyl-ACP methyl ester carboxylesterase
MLLGLLLAGCGSGSGESELAASPSPVGEPLSVTQVTTSLMPQRVAERMGVDWEELRSAAGGLQWQLVDAAGVRVAAACTGNGSPTVVYLNGFTSAAADSWAIPVVEQAADNRVCLFDRPGVGLSDARSEPYPRTSTPQMHAEEMFALMDALGEEGPFLLVAHSYGGLVARTAATIRPDDVVGMVLVDATSPLVLAPGSSYADAAEPWPGEGGVTDISAVHDLVGDGPDMGDAPIIVLQAGVWNQDSPLAFSPTGEADWEGWQRQAATLSNNAVLGVVDDADHMIPMRDPDAVVAATTAASEAIRDGNAAMGECPAGMAEAGVACKQS